MTQEESKHVALNNKKKHNTVLLCLTDTLYIHICVKHFGMANIKIKDSEVYTKT